VDDEAVKYREDNFRRGVDTATVENMTAEYRAVLIGEGDMQVRSALANRADQGDDFRLPAADRAIASPGDATNPRTKPGAII